MNRKKLIPALATALALGGCMTMEPTPVESRIAQRAEAFDALDAHQQGRVRLGHIQLGDTTNMLWMAFGEPTSTAPAAEGADPAVETWTYLREPPPWMNGPQPPVPAYQPGALFAPEPPPPPQRIIKTYVLTDGVITDMNTRHEKIGN